MRCESGKEDVDNLMKDDPTFVVIHVVPDREQRNISILDMRMYICMAIGLLLRFQRYGEKRVAPGWWWHNDKPKPFIFSTSFQQEFLHRILRVIKLRTFHGEYKARRL
jgi:hypothetical protein